MAENELEGMAFLDFAGWIVGGRVQPRCRRDRRGNREEGQCEIGTVGSQ